MNKTILLLICFFVNLSIVNASIEVKNTPYNVKLDNEVINIKEIIYKNNALFNIDINNYEISNLLVEYKENNKDINKFSTIVYYGYLNNPTSSNYVITQIMIWKLIGGYDVELLNITENMINEYNDLYKKVANHYLKPSFFNSTYNTFIWLETKLHYETDAIILDNPIVDGLRIETIDNTIKIYPEKVGKYHLTFSKDYDNEICCFQFKSNSYCQSKKGPEDINYSFEYNVDGFKINIRENLIGINGRTGDAQLNSTYQIYYKNELKQTTSDLDNIYLRSYYKYTLKDISNVDGISNSEDIIIQMNGKEQDIIIDKYVISKNVSISVIDDYKYNIYLKSNNELYEVVDKNTNVITLPYGTYYVANKETSYYKEIIVNDNIDEEFTIKSECLEERIPEEIDKEEFKEELPIDTIIDNIENPKTLDNIYNYIYNFFFSIILINLLLKILVVER